MNAFELERFVGRRLRALPAPRAPLTLLPRVLAAARAWSQRPWYAREWFTWPIGWQVGSLALLTAILGAAAVMIPAAQVMLVNAATSLAGAIAFDVPQVAESLQVSTSAMRVIWRALVQPFLPYVFVIVVLMCGACASVVLALNRVVFGRALHS
jgi:hypothetical protein